MAGSIKIGKRGDEMTIHSFTLYVPVIELNPEESGDLTVVPGMASANKTTAKANAKQIGAIALIECDVLPVKGEFVV